MQFVANAIHIDAVREEKKKYFICHISYSKWKRTDSGAAGGAGSL